MKSSSLFALDAFVFYMLLSFICIIKEFSISIFYFIRFLNFINLKYYIIHIHCFNFRYVFSAITIRVPINLYKVNISVLLIFFELVLKDYSF